MASPTQTAYITDLAVLKTKEFKEVKELLTSSGIVGADSQVLATAGTLAEICNALTDFQASKLIDLLIATEAPARGRVYGANRVKKTVAALDDIKSVVDGWGF